MFISYYKSGPLRQKEVFFIKVPIQNWLRTSMKRRRFTYLAILHVNGSIVNTITSSEILREC